MKRTLIVCLALLLIAGYASAGKLSDSKYMTRDFAPGGGDGRTYFEGFEAGVPPAGWTAVVNNPYTWEQDDYAPYEGIYYATCLYDATYSGPQDEWICFQYTIEAGDDELSFAVNASVYWAIDPYQNYNLHVVIDGVEKWNYVDDTVDPVTWEWQVYSVSLAEYSVGQTIEVCFGYTGYDGAQGSFDAILIGEEPPPPPEPCCPFEHECVVWDFNISDDGVTYFDCGAGPNPWGWGYDPQIPGIACDGVPVTNVMGTALGGAYPVSTGGGFYLGPVPVTWQCFCLELCHYYDIETGFDGGNVKVSADGGATWTQISPFDGYDDILDSTYYIAECVHGEWVFCGHQTGFVRECFDLTDYMGSDVLIGFFFGSDSSVTYPGWYIKWAKLGSDEFTAVEETSWGVIKALYR